MEFVPFIKSGEITKVEVSGNRFKVLLKASSERRDKEGDMFLKSAWAHPEDKAWFLSKGFYDYNHLSKILRVDKGTPEMLYKSQLAIAQSIIGFPTSLEWSERDDRLISEGYLHAENEFVKAIVGGLKAGNDRWGASVTGGSYRPSQQTVQKYGDRTWDRARLQSIAICPLMEAQNEDTALILKSTAAALMPQVEGTMDATVVRMSDAIEGGSRVRAANRIIQIFGSDPRAYDVVYQELMREIASGSISKNEAEICEFLQAFGIPENDCADAARIILAKIK